MTASSRQGWPWWHAIWLAIAGAVFAYWNWVIVLGAAVDMPTGFNTGDVWLNRPPRERLPFWVPLWAPLTVLGLVAFLLAGRAFRRGGPQTWRTIRMCFYLNVLSFPFGLALNEIVLTIYVFPPAPWYVPVVDVALNFLSGFALAALNLLSHGMAWLVVSIAVGVFIAQTSRITSMMGRANRPKPA